MKRTDAVVSWLDSEGKIIHQTSFLSLPFAHVRNNCRAFPDSFSVRILWNNGESETIVIRDSWRKGSFCEYCE